MHGPEKVTDYSHLYPRVTHEELHFAIGKTLAWAERFFWFSVLTGAGAVISAMALGEGPNFNAWLSLAVCSTVSLASYANHERLMRRTVDEVIRQCSKEKGEAIEKERAEAAQPQPEESDDHNDLTAALAHMRAHNPWCLDITAINEKTRALQEPLESPDSPRSCPPTPGKEKDAPPCIEARLDEPN